MTWDEALDDIAGAHPRARSSEGRPQRGHVPRRPAGRGRLHRARARGLGRRRPQLAHQHLLVERAAPATSSGWASTGRAPTTPTPNVILLISAHLESGHYFNPHAQRVMEGKAARREADRLRHAALEHRHARRPLARAVAGLARRRSCSRSRNHLIRERRYDREFVRRWWNWQEYLEQRAARAAEPTFESFEAALARALRRATRSSSPSASRASTAATLARGRATVVATAGTRLSTHTWRSAAAGNLGGWQVSRCALPAQRAARRGRHARAARTRTPGTSSCRGRSTRRRTRRRGTSSPGRVEYPLAMNELSFLLPHFLEGGPRQARRLLHARLQPGLDEPRRLLLDRGAHRRERRSACTSRSRRPGARPPTSPTTCCRWASAPSATTSTPTRRTTRQWLGFRQPVLRAARERLGRDRSPTRAR